MKKYHLYLIVAISGTAIVAIVILGVRILGPFYGVSLLLWSTLLSVTLAALSAGYLLGGRWADREVNAIRLNWMLLLAGCWLILIPYIKLPVLHLADFFGFRLALLMATFIMFFPPMTFLSVIMPFTIKLNTQNLAEVGQSVGKHYAISMMAGVFSAILTSFLLIPNFGVTRLILVIGLILIQLAIWGFWIDRKNRKKAVPVSVIVLHISFILIWQAPTRTIDKENGRLFVQQSQFGEISVVDKDEVRYLLIDGAIHTMVRDSTLETLNRYGIAIDLCKELFFRPGKMLLLGLGGGSIVNDFIKDSWKVEVVEIDPVVIDVAQKFFNLNPDRCEIHKMDGRQFLLQKTQPYDFIVHNACLSPGNPSHLMLSREMFELFSSRLAKDGILAINIEAVGWEAALIKSIAMTLRQNFQTVLALPTSEPPNTVGSIVLLAANRELEIDDAALGHPADFINLDSYLHWVVVQRNHAWDNRYEPDTLNAQLLTDDFNPIDFWTEEVNLAVRYKLRETFALNIQNY